MSSTHLVQGVLLPNGMPAHKKKAFLNEVRRDLRRAAGPDRTFELKVQVVRSWQADLSDSPQSAPALVSARPRERRPISRRAAARAPGGDDDPSSERVARAYARDARAAFAEARGDDLIGGGR